jgi:tripartite-type tricarboxylate transporter receptor subunit TctC
MTRTIVLIAGLIALGSFSDVALAQFYRGKTVTMIINYPAGGPTDIEGRIIAQHLPTHIPGKPTIVIKNVGGAGGVIGTNQLADATPNGDTIGFFTLDIIAQLVGNPALKVNYADFVMIAGVENPLVAYIRKDTPPGLKVATDIWRGSVEPTMGSIVMPLWQIAARGKDGSYPRSRALPDLPTFEEFFALVNGGKKPSGFSYEVLRASSDPLVAMFRTALMPPKTSNEAVAVMRAAFVDLWKNPQFIRDYANVVKTEPILITGAEAQEIVADLAKVKPEIKTFLVDYSNRLVR